MKLDIESLRSAYLESYLSRKDEIVNAEIENAKNEILANFDEKINAEINKKIEQDKIKFAELSQFLQEEQIVANEEIV